MNALEVRELKRSFQQFELNIPQLELKPGYVMGLLGMNGAGKSTLFRLIANHLKADHGSISIFGQDHLREEQTVRQLMAYLPDTPGLPSELTLGSIKRSLQVTCRRWDDNRYEALMQRLGPSEKMRAGRLSKGEQIKFNLILTLSRGADLLLLDEPTAGLDPVARMGIIDLIREAIQEQEVSVLFATHITSDLENLADYLTILHRGSVLISSDMEALHEQWKLVKCVDLPEGDPLGLNPIGLRKSGHGWSFLARGQAADRLNDEKHYMVETVTLDQLLLHLTQEESK